VFEIGTHGEKQFGPSQEFSRITFSPVEPSQFGGGKEPKGKEITLLWLGRGYLWGANGG